MQILNLFRKNIFKKTFKTKISPPKKLLQNFASSCKILLQNIVKESGQDLLQHKLVLNLNNYI